MQSTENVVLFILMSYIELKWTGEIRKLKQGGFWGFQLGRIELAWWSNGPFSDIDFSSSVCFSVEKWVSVSRT